MAYYDDGVNFLRLQNLLQNIACASVPKLFTSLVNGASLANSGSVGSKKRLVSEWPRILFMDRIIPTRTAGNECLSLSDPDGFNENADQI